MSNSSHAFQNKSDYELLERPQGKAGSLLTVILWGFTNSILWKAKKKKSPYSWHCLFLNTSQLPSTSSNGHWKWNAGERGCRSHISHGIATQVGGVWMIASIMCEICYRQKTVAWIIIQLISQYSAQEPSSVLVNLWSCTLQLYSCMRALIHSINKLNAYYVSGSDLEYSSNENRIEFLTLWSFTLVDGREIIKK